MGVLLPTTASVHTRLEQLNASLKYAVPLANALLQGLTRRFGELEHRKDLFQASVSHPQFKLRWTNTEAAKMNAKSILLEGMQAVSSSNNVEASSSVKENADNGFLCCYNTSVITNSASA